MAVASDNNFFTPASTNRRVKMALRMTKLSTIKTLAGFDFSFQPSLDRNRILALAQLDFVDRNEVIHFLGPPGTGKSHLATALGVEAVKAAHAILVGDSAALRGGQRSKSRRGSRRPGRRSTRWHQTARPCPGTRACRRRRSARLLASHRGRMAEDPRPALLGAQDRECAEPAEEPGTESQAGAAGDLDGRDPQGCPHSFDAFVETWGVKYEKAVECLAKDREALLGFYDFPAEHWKHLRTTNIIESAFATAHHRTVRAKGCLSNKTAGHDFQAR
jgi:IstB-like ATP binding protein/Transposase, Mutator family